MVKAQVKCYIAHTFKHRFYVRDKLTPKIHALGISTKNPFYEPDGTTLREEVRIADDADINGLSTSDIAKEVSNGYSKISKKGKEKEKWIRMVRSRSKMIVPRDLHFIDSTDFTVAYMSDISAGTTCEMFYTGVIKRRPVFLLTNNPEVFEHPWIIHSCRYGKVCNTEEDLIKALKRKYN